MMDTSDNLERADLNIPKGQEDSIPSLGEDMPHTIEHHCKLSVQKSYRWSEINDSTNIDQIKFSSCYSNTFLMIHCISAFYYGFSMTVMNNLGKPIIEKGMGIKGEKSIAEWLANINLSFGIGKMFGSITAGAIQKRLGKLGTLYLAEPVNIIGVSLQVIPNIWCFLFGRILNGFYCGFNTTTAPRLIIECYPTEQRGWKTSIYSLAVCVGVCSSFCIGYAFGNEKLENYWQFFVVLPYCLALLRI